MRGALKFGEGHEGDMVTTTTTTGVARDEGREKGGEPALPMSGKKEHLVVMVHGLFGSDKHLANVVRVMEENFVESSVKIFVSSCNKRTKTLDGIQKCGERCVLLLAKQVLNPESTAEKQGRKRVLTTLADVSSCFFCTGIATIYRLISELDAYLASLGENDLKTISFIGHSMGGLIIRYAIGHRYRVEEPSGRETIFGLIPLHYVAITTPHVGCNDTYLSDIKKEDSVTPCLRWMGQIPCLGKIPALAFHVFESFFVWLVLRRTGDDLFLRDKDKIVEQLASYSIKRKDSAAATAAEEEEEKPRPPPYLEALASFTERTCYGNIRGDHVVAWENATIRRKVDLPKIKRKDAPYGIVNEEVSPRSLGGAPAPAPNGPLNQEGDLASSPTFATCPKIEGMIRNLEALGWRRVDVKTKILVHKGAPWAHDNIISKTDCHDNFKVVASHSSSLLLQSIKTFEGGAGGAKK